MDGDEEELCRFGEGMWSLWGLSPPIHFIPHCSLQKGVIMWSNRAVRKFCRRVPENWAFFYLCSGWGCNCRWKQLWLLWDCLKTSLGRLQARCHWSGQRSLNSHMGGKIVWFAALLCFVPFSSLNETLKVCLCSENKIERLWSFHVCYFSNKCAQFRSKIRLLFLLGFLNVQAEVFLWLSPVTKAYCPRFQTL